MKNSLKSLLLSALTLFALQGSALAETQISVPGEVMAGDQAQIRITLDEPAQKDMYFQLDTVANTFHPGTVVVRAGQQSADFDLFTRDASQDQHVRIVARHQGEAHTANFKILGSGGEVEASPSLTDQRSPQYVPYYGQVQNGHWTHPVYPYPYYPYAYSPYPYYPNYAPYPYPYNPNQPHIYNF